MLKNPESFVGRSFTTCGKSQNRASGVKTPDEKAWFMSELKLGPPKIRLSSASCSAATLAP
jgi:hypothetical protein